MRQRTRGGRSWFATFARLCAKCCWPLLSRRWTTSTRRSFSIPLSVLGHRPLTTLPVLLFSARLSLSLSPPFFLSLSLSLSFYPSFSMCVQIYIYIYIYEYVHMSISLSLSLYPLSLLSLKFKQACSQRYRDCCKRPIGLVHLR